METTGICRFCHAACGVKVEIEAGRITKLIGDIDNPMYHGYSCVKGRNFHEFHYAPDRVLHPLRRRPDGTHEQVAASEAFREVADRLHKVIDRYGPRSVAVYGGTFSNFCPAGVMLRDAFMDAVGSPMRFSNASIDQPGKPIAMAMHGKWGAGPQAFADSDVCMLIGANPLVSMWGGIPAFNPAKRLHEARKAGLKLIVADPRRTETARKADIHLQCLPGHDSELLASLLHVIIAEKLYDEHFVRSETEGFDELATAVKPFTPEFVAPIVGLAPEELVAAARMFATAKRGNCTTGTGPNMAPHGVLMEYLALVLNTVCGRWIRAGEPVPNRGVLFRSFSGQARAEKPRPAAGFGEQLRVHDLRDTAAGLPTSALADEILMPGEGQIRALFVVGGNPLTAWPNRNKTQRALESLDLLVAVDPRLSDTAKLAHYVFGPRFGFEMPALSFGNEGITVYGLSIGYQEPYAQYQPQLIEPPAGSEVFEDWRIFYELGKAMNFELAYRGTPFDMQTPPTTEALLEGFVARSRVPLSEIKRHPHGAIFPDPQPLAESRASDWPHRLRIAVPAMMNELATLAHAAPPAAARTHDEAGLDLLMVSRRQHETYNSVGHALPALKKRRPFNPAYLNPEDATSLAVVTGDRITISNAAGSITALVEVAPDVRRGVLSLAHGFAASEDGSTGASSSVLVDDSGYYEPISGLPPMSAVPVRVARR